MPFPAAACLVQEKLGASQAAAFDWKPDAPGHIWFAIAEAYLLAGKLVMHW
jgi:3-oxoacyl-[acyl-carrier-protein] synthase III